MCFYLNTTEPLSYLSSKINSPLLVKRYELVSSSILAKSCSCESGQNILYLVTPTVPNELTADCFDLSAAYGLVNGQSVGVEIAELSTSLEEIDSYFSMYPNPTDKTLYVRFKDSGAVENMSYSIFDSTGKLVYQENRASAFSSFFQIHTADYRDGIYFFVVRSRQTGELLAREEIVIGH